MDRLQDLCLVGFSHRTAALAVREQYAVQSEDIVSYLTREREESGLSEALVLTTCNRTEVLVIAEHEPKPALAVRNRLFQQLSDDHLYTYRGVEAIMHFFRVACGLDSLVIGETEIMAQVKNAASIAEQSGTLGVYLRPLVKHALATGKRVRNETELGQGTLSVARVAVDVTHHAFGDLSNNRALVIGAGETGMLVARHLRDAGTAGIDFANRTVARAQSAAEEFGGGAFGLEDLHTPLAEVDIVVVCIDGGEKTLRPEHFKGIRRDEPQLVIDLSVPRAVDSEVSNLESVLLYDMDDLVPVVEANRRARGDAGEASSDILVAQVHKFLSLRTYAAFSPAISEMRERFDEVQAAVVERVTEGEASPRELELAVEMSRRLLDLALEQIKLSARYSRSETSLERDYRHFLDAL